MSSNNAGIKSLKKAQNEYLGYVSILDMLARTFLLMWYTNMMPRIEQVGHAIRQGFQETRRPRRISSNIIYDYK